MIDVVGEFHRGVQDTHLGKTFQNSLLRPLTSSKIGFNKNTIKGLFCDIIFGRTFLQLLLFLGLRFTHTNGLKLIGRAHQLVMLGSC